ncbi:MAG: DUF2141 domain-containing protein [Geopsychrobacter sp.]|nr:DUF2141 domain-containing protein [Geopsychrobacter sp.]
MFTDLDRRLLLFLMIILTAGCAPAPRTECLQVTGTGRLVLTISGFRNDQGEALIYLYTGAAGFPQADAPGLLRFHHTIHQGRVQLTLMKLPFNNYAISVLHDENRDGQMNKSPLGFPREGFGFSRNPNLLYGPPDYLKVRFLFLNNPQDQLIEMQYQTLRKKQPPRSLRHQAAGCIPDRHDL